MSTLQLDEFTLNCGNLEVGELKKLEIGFSTQQSAGGKVWSEALWAKSDQCSCMGRS